MWGWLRKRLAPPELAEPLWQFVLQSVPPLGLLSPEAQAQLRALSARFLARKAITGAGGLQPEPEQKAIVAALCCLPVLELGFHWLRGWHEVILYPSAFRVHRRHHDEDSGVVSEWPDELAGEAWEQGPLILSWQDIEADLADPFSGYALVAHEIAHKLDMLDGVSDGTPPMPAGLDWREWTRTMQAAYDRLCAELEAGREAPIDPYAAEAPDEFFAVTSEYFFSAPALLEQAMPDVHRLLRRFYRPATGLSPVQRAPP
ncbi:MAG: hypothetical protein KatS3mg125_0250 [Lysobacterales bacterium]|jgi:Mlc titration factor MtfA (ptsG expression regulator)|nr:MAG: hypothetical protein KatS3mg125_0250 [Xanthomonadales bacterium]